MYKIKTKRDIDNFIKQSNGLHDGYILSVQYCNNGIKHLDGGGYEISCEANELRIRILITSISDAEIELIFKEISEWQIFDNMWDITDTAVSFSDDGMIVWTDGLTTDKSTRREDSYVVARSMEYRFCDA